MTKEQIMEKWRSVSAPGIEAIKMADKGNSCFVCGFFPEGFEKYVQYAIDEAHAAGFREGRIAGLGEIQNFGAMVEELHSDGDILWVGIKRDQAQMDHFSVVDLKKLKKAITALGGEEGK